MLEGRPGSTIHIFLLIVFNLFIIIQQLSYYLIVVFLDYLFNKNSARTKRFIYIVLGLMAVNIALLAVNYSKGFYFYISDTNYFAYGTSFLIRFYISYSAVVAAIIDIFLSKWQLRAIQINLITFFAILSGAGAVLDILLPGAYFIWAFLTTAMLVAYFYIIHSDTTQDAMTGLGNRSSFTEFINLAEQSGARQSYIMAQFDINDLRKINSDFGTKAGDQALTDVATLLKKCTRQYDFIARMGDDEFLVVIKAKSDIKQLISRILKSLGELNQMPDRQYFLSVNYGYNTYTTNNDQSIDEFLQTLNERIFQYKNEQREDNVKKRRGIDNKK